MANILIIYSTTDGHTLEICNRLGKVINEDGHIVTVKAVQETQGMAFETFDKIVIGASIRYGAHGSEVHEFIRNNRRILEEKPSAFFSVNAVARKPDKNQPHTNPYMRKFLRKIPWRPKVLAVFAGKIDYPKYNMLDRTVIRLIMWMTNGPTDPNGVFDFTDWLQVEAFAGLIGEM